MTHIVRPGETLGTIAAQYGTTVMALMRTNGIRNPNMIYPGQAMKIPRSQWYQQPYAAYPQSMMASGQPMPPMSAMPMPGAVTGPVPANGHTYDPTGMTTPQSMPETQWVGPHTHHPHEHRLNLHQQRLDQLEARVANLEARIQQVGR